jgi:glutathione-regulated potassium-efflux system ancillary protein KefG
LKQMKAMVIIAHPDIEKSRGNRRRILELQKYPEITVHNLYKEYPDFCIDVKREQNLLVQHDRIVFQFPFYWYTCPALLKKWFEDVLEYGWAYGLGGEKLTGKLFILAITTGGSEKSYRAGDYNWTSISEYIKPIQATITRCSGTFLPAFVLHGIKSASDATLDLDAKEYVEYIQSPWPDDEHH